VKLVTAEQMRAIEAASEAAGVSTGALMEAAGGAAALEAWTALSANNAHPVLVLAGPGNNGGDGLVAARHLTELGADVHVYLMRSRHEDDAVWAAARDAGVEMSIATDDPGQAHLDALLAVAHCVLDALLGTGKNRAIDGDLARVLERLAIARQRETPPLLIALDLPTGANPDTGTADALTVAADMTVSFGFTKVGLTQSPARNFAGEIVRFDFRLPPGLGADLPFEESDLRAAQIAAMPRPPDANKGTFGHAVIAGGSLRYPGAVRLAAEACARSGTGLTTIAAPSVVQALVASSFPDATHEPLPSTEGAMAGSEAARALLRALRGVDALLVGPGLGLTSTTGEFVRDLVCGLDAVDGLRAVVLDADALNAVAKHRGWHEWTSVPRVLTPHPGEMARLLRCSVAEVQGDRIGVATRFAHDTDSVVVLKGAGTIVAAPDGRARISQTANAMLATAGTGDVLAGIIVGLIAQGAAPFDAAAAAVYLHAECGAQVERELGAAGGIAQDLLSALPGVRRALDAGARRSVSPFAEFR
jgi:ADP-dependent NAD(P)H-hydrate dehydratase / NAD(P)H-hydrate epimerase